MSDTAREGPPPVIAGTSAGAAALAAWLGEGRRGTVEVRGPGGTCRLYLADGALRIAADDPLAVGGNGPLTVLEPLIVLLGSATADNLKFTATPVATAQGRLVPAKVLMEAAVRGRDRVQLWTLVGGRSVALRMTGDSALSGEAMAGIEPRLQALLARFVRSSRPAELIGDDPGALETLRDVARLRAVGLLAPAEADADGARPALSSHSKELFVRRIADELERRPLRINSDEHRRQVVEMLRNLGVWNHYDLLRIGRHQDEQAIHQAYIEVASLAHPSHAEKLGLEGKAAALDLLFEATTEAYLDLTHPDRRRAYDRDLGPDLSGTASDKRRREKASVARDMYVRARRMAMEQDLQPVLELMQQAVQLDPQAEYYQLLGDVQRRNPQWKAGALASYRDAVRCRPDDPELRLAFARALEEGGDREQAGIQYRAGLELRPNDPKLMTALEDFENATSGKKKKKSLRGAEKGSDGGGDKKKGQDKGKSKSKDEQESDGGMFANFRKLFRRGKED